MATICYDADADPAALSGRRIAVVGYGNQGHAHALNLRDSGCQVRVGARDGPGWRRAGDDGLSVMEIADACQWADIVSLLLPDQLHQRVFADSIRPYLAPGKLLLVAHGFSLLYGLIDPPAEADVALLAPVGPGHIMRRLYLEGSGIPAVLAVDQNASGEAGSVAMAYARALGCTRAGVMLTTVQEETETDLFGEQAVLCGGMSELIMAGYDTLVEAGYQPELAYFECIHQVKLIVDLVYEGGLEYMRSRISDTAELGDYLTGPRVIDHHVREAMRDILRDIRDGAFARRWMEEFEHGSPTLRAGRSSRQAAGVESVGRALRSMMPWLGSADGPDDAAGAAAAADGIRPARPADE